MFRPNTDSQINKNSMDSSVSAFAIYKAKTKSNHSKKQLKKQKFIKTLSIRTENLIPEQTMRNAAKNLKLKNQKNLNGHIKKKILKKKKKNKKQRRFIDNTEANNKPSNSVPISDSPQDQQDNDSLSDEVPLLVPAVHVNDSSGDESDANAGELRFTPVTTNSVSEGLRAFSWMIAPFEAKEFFVNIWEKKPLHIKRAKPKYYLDIMSTSWIDNILRTHNIQYSKHLDVTSYVNEKRETHNLVGRAHPHVIWDFYLQGCSIRLLNPQAFTPKLHLLNATLQEFFYCFVGANAYLTPPDSQGFAPHFDDIEAFILQIEGRKRWKVYQPRNIEETLPRFPSKNFDQKEIGEPILEVVLQAGDLLYLPRGYIHQAVTIAGQHSLHITVSMNQKHSWGDLFEKLIPVALQATINDNIDMRKGLPFDIYDNFGLVNSDIKCQRKTELTKLIKVFCDKIKSHLDIEHAVDEMAKLYQHDVLPPVLTDMEKAVTVYGDHNVMIGNGKVINRVEMNLDCRIRLLRKNILRMVMEQETIKIYHCTENSLDYHGNELQYLEIPESLAPAVETLITSYPEYVFVENLDVPSQADKLQVACDLWERGIIMTEFPLPINDDD